MENDSLKNRYRKDGLTTSVPLDIFSYVQNFCHSISIEKPIYIPSCPGTNDIKNECFPNVDRRIEMYGGKKIIGWEIWEWYGVMIEAEFHAVWLDSNKELKDITPKPILCDKILFLPDDKLQDEGKQVDNIRRSLLKGNILIEEFIRCHERKFEILNKGERANQREVSLSDNEAKELLAISERSTLLFVKILNSLPGRNDLCRCGSGKKFKKCCGK